MARGERLIRPQGWEPASNKAKSPHLPARRMEVLTEKVPQVNYAKIADAVNTKLGAKTTSYYDRADISSLTESVKVFSNGGWVQRTAGSFFGKQLQRADHEAALVSGRGINYLIGNTNPMNLQVSDALSVAVANGQLPAGKHTLTGPSGASFPAEVYEAAAVQVGKDGESKTRQVSKPVRVGENKSIEILDYAGNADLNRSILTQLVAYNLDSKPTNKATAPFVLKIEGGNGGISIEQAVKDAMLDAGVRNFGFFILTHGPDLKTNAAILTHMPKSRKGIKNMADLRRYQAPIPLVGGTMMVTGHVTKYHPDGTMYSRIQTDDGKGQRYEMHRHGIGVGENGEPIGGHINGEIPGAETTTYVVIKPIEKVIEVDASVPQGTKEELRKINHANATLGRRFVDQDYASAATRKITELGLNDQQLHYLNNLTGGDAHMMLRLLDPSQTTPAEIPLITQITHAFVADAKNAFPNLTNAKQQFPDTMSIDSQGEIVKGLHTVVQYYDLYELALKNMEMAKARMKAEMAGKPLPKNSPQGAGMNDVLFNPLQLWEASSMATRVSMMSIQNITRARTPEENWYPGVSEYFAQFRPHNHADTLLYYANQLRTLGETEIVTQYKQWKEERLRRIRPMEHPLPRR